MTATRFRDGVVLKENGSPILTVVHPVRKSKLRLVGVSHGSTASANLVRSVINASRPDAVIVELCEDRFLSISLEAQIAPKFNDTLIDLYNERLLKMKTAEEARLNSTGISATSRQAKRSLFQRIGSTLSFASTQGLVGGVFVLLGIFVGTLQKYTNAAGGDEFVTAMRSAGELGVPILLGDAPQNDTVRSMKKIFASETINPTNVVEGASSLAFSALGAFPISSDRRLARKIGESNLIDSSWLSIPEVYAENSGMLTSLLPLLAIAAIPTLLQGLDYVISSDISIAQALSRRLGSTEGVYALSHAADFIDQLKSPVESILSLLPSVGLNSLSLSDNVDSTFGISPVADSLLEGFLDVLSVLLLVRMAKLIGQDRDAIIANKINTFCAMFPEESEFVVVIGMLHCNGVARWLISGDEPLIEP